MGSCCTSKKGYPLIIEPDGFSSNKDSSQFTSPRTIRSLEVDFPYSHCNLLIWTGTEPEFSTIFQKSYFKVPISQSFEMTFNVISYYSYSAQSPLCIDCLVFYVNTMPDLDIVKVLSKKHTNIPVHILVTEQKVSGIDRVVVIPPGPMSLLWNHLFIQQTNLEKLLREIFNDMDKDQNGFINNEEIFDALSKLDKNLTQVDTNRIFKTIDKNEDGKINFNEFSYWWKRGRQRKTSVLDLTANFTERINYYLPKMANPLQRRGIDKRKLQKKIVIKARTMKESKVELKITVAKSAKREQLLRKVEEMLNLNIHEFWISFVLTCKNQACAVKRLKLIEDMLYYLKFSFLNNQFPDLPEFANTQVRLDKNEIWFSVCFNFNNDSVSTISERLNNIERIFVSPIDDHITLTINSGLNFEELKKKRSKCFLQSIEPGTVTIESEHWAGYSSLIELQGKTGEAIKKLLALEGEISYDSPNSDLFTSLHEYLQMGFGFIGKLSQYIPIVADAVEINPDELEEKIKIYVRFLNIGAELLIEGEEIDAIFNNDI